MATVSAPTSVKTKHIAIFDQLPHSHLKCTNLFPCAKFMCYFLCSNLLQCEVIINLSFNKTGVHNTYFR